MRHDNNAAYDYSQFEEEKSQEAVIREVARKNHRTKGVNVVKSIVYMIIGITVVFSLLYCKAMQVELEAEQSDLLNQISVIKSDTTLLRIELESKLSLSKIEEYAKDELGLEKLDDQKIEYINFNEADKAEVIKDKNLWEKLVDGIKGFFV